MRLPESTEREGQRTVHSPQTTAGRLLVGHSQEASRHQPPLVVNQPRNLVPAIHLVTMHHDVLPHVHRQLALLLALKLCAAQLRRGRSAREARQEARPTQHPKHMLGSNFMGRPRRWVCTSIQAGCVFASKTSRVRDQSVGRGRGGAHCIARSHSAIAHPPATAALARRLTFPPPLRRHPSRRLGSAHGTKRPTQHAK
jgi:hypothetical protein